MSRTGVFILTLVLACSWSLAGVDLSAAPAEKDKEKRQAVLFVSIFNQDGFSVSGVRVSVKRKGAKKPTWKGVTDRRGESAIRLPAKQGTYEVTTHSKELVNQTKTVEIEGQQRVDLFFHLARKKKK